MVDSVVTIDDRSGPVTIFDLQIKDEMVEKEQRKRTLYLALPVIFISI